MAHIKKYISAIDGLAKQGINENPNPGDFNQAMASPIGSINKNDEERVADDNVTGKDPEVIVHEEEIDDQVVRVERKSLLTGNVNTMELPTTQEKLDIFFNSPKNERPLIQDLFPELSVDEREFLQTGATPEEWANIELKELKESIESILS